MEWKGGAERSGRVLKGPAPWVYGGHEVDEDEEAEGSRDVGGGGRTPGCLDSPPLLFSWCPEKAELLLKVSRWSADDDTIEGSTNDNDFSKVFSPSPPRYMPVVPSPEAFFPQTAHTCTYRRIT